MSEMQKQAIRGGTKASSFLLSVVLESKIKNLKQWIRDKELEKSLQQKNLAPLLENYLTKLAIRVSEITSIAFPQHKLQIEEAYEPLITCKNIDYDFETSEVDIIKECLKARGSYMVVDGAGMGKSTFSKHLVSQLLFKSEKIPLFFECRNFDEEKSLILNLVSVLDKASQSFDLELFERLIQKGRFIIILDGFDEVEPRNQRQLARQIYELSLKGGENTLIVTSRPQDILPELLKGHFLKFDTFTLIQAKSLLRRYDRVSGLHIGRDLENQLDSVPEKFLGSPLLVSLLYRTFGVNNSIAARMCTFYDDIYGALFKGHDLINKNGFQREKKSKLDYEEFRKLLRIFSYMMSLRGKTHFKNDVDAIDYIRQASKYSNVSLLSYEAFLDDLLVAVPLMIREGSEIKFMHKTLMEFFSAEYLVFSPNSIKVASSIYHSKLAAQFENTFDFVNDINSSLFNAVVTKSLGKDAQQITSTENVLSRIISTLIFMHEVKFGIWNKRENSVITRNRETYPDLTRLSPGALKKAFGTTSYVKTKWLELEFEETIYYFACAYRDKSSSYFENAISVLCDNVDQIYTFEKLAENNKLLFETIGIGSWVSLVPENLKTLQTCKLPLALCMEVLEIEASKNKLPVRLLSRERIDAVLKQIDDEEKFESDIEQFLSEQ
jgi:hypothetical protein